VRELALKIKELDANDAYRISCSARLLTKLYDMAVIETKQNLELCSKVSASAFCR
jgi:U3 small nucleolar ribonucleoprotein protein IMP3